ncbi:MAG TPA: response regulator transcription factor [Mycobacteriales bacterium]|nr:response regulator transcription factor [Mycobacteriales bacterium]
MDRGALAPVTVALVEDHPVVHAGVRAWLAQETSRPIELIAAGDSVEVAFAGPGRLADVLLFDLNLHGRMAIDEVGRLARLGRRVVVYSEHADDATVLAVLDRGAFAFLAKKEGREHCVATILAAAADRPYVAPQAAGSMAADDRPGCPALSDQERTALLLWFQSMSKSAVAARMGIAESTVRQYIQRARIKYANAGRPAPTRTQLLARAIQDGLIRADEVTEYASRAVDSDLRPRQP